MSTVSEISGEDWAIWRDYITAHRELARALDRQLRRDAGISHPDFTVLLTLSEAQERRLRTGELAESLAWEKSRVSHQVSRMEARGLLARTECDEDARGTWIALTTEGRRVLLRAIRDHAATIRALFFDALEPEQKTALARSARSMLDRVAAF